MKIAYCIIAHKYTKVLETTIAILSKSDDVYIHIDKKSNIIDFSNIKQADNIYILKERIDTRWGTFSQIETTLQLMKEASLKQYDYIFIISGDCLPVKSNQEIHNFLEKNYPNEYVAVDKKSRYSERVKYIYPEDSMFFKKNKTIIEKMIAQTRIKLGIMKKNPLYNQLPEIYKGTNWFTITGELNSYILDYVKANPTYLKAFKHSLCADEVFFQTVILNSKFKNNVYKGKAGEKTPFLSLRYIDWESGPEYPKILNSDDFEKIRETDCLFARKFDDTLNFEEYASLFDIK
ncbi:MAG: beta-1,6-N-acetylglucosaminyltransferase [Culicoidibacterales bacterium]